MSWLARKLWPAALFGLAIAALAGCAPSGTATATSAPPTPTPTTARATPTTPAAAAACAVGQRCEASGIALTVNYVDSTDAVATLSSKAGNIFLIVDATIENVSYDQAPYNPLYFKVRAADGTEYNPASAAPLPSLKRGTLSRGDQVRGNVAFEVPEDASDLATLYQPLVPGAGFQEIRVNLGR